MKIKHNCKLHFHTKTELWQRKHGKRYVLIAIQICCYFLATQLPFQRLFEPQVLCLHRNCQPWHLPSLLLLPPTTVIQHQSLVSAEIFDRFIVAMNLQLCTWCHILLPLKRKMSQIQLWKEHWELKIHVNIHFFNKQQEQPAETQIKKGKKG